MLASDRIHDVLRPYAVTITVIAILLSVCAAPADGQLIIPADHQLNQPTTSAASSTTATSNDAETLLKDARSAIGVRNYALASQLIQQAQLIPGADQLAYSPVKAQQELHLWMHQDRQAPLATNSAAVDPSDSGSLPGKMSEADIQSILQTLLQARQSLALGNTPAAQQLLDSLAGKPMDFKQVGDSPQFVAGMIQRQNELTNLAKAQDPTYNVGAAEFLLSQAEALIHYDDFETATLLIDQARTFPVPFDAKNNTPQRLENMIARAKANAINITDSPATPVAQAVTGKAEVSRLISMAQLAIAKEDWTHADALIQQAKAFNVPETEFDANEVRPWQLDLQVRKALNRTGASVAMSDLNPASDDNAIFDPAVVQASATSNASPVVQAKYDPDSDTTRNVQVAGYESATGSGAIAGLSSSTFEPIPNRGKQLFDSGMDALSENDREKAAEYFRNAWQFQDQLDPTTRQTIQDQLSRINAITPSQSVDTLDLEDIRMQQQATYRRYQSEVLKQRALAERQLKDSPREALETMANLRNRIAQSNLEKDARRPLLVSIDRNISEMQEYIEKNLSAIENQEFNDSRKRSVDEREERRVEVEKQMQQLVEDYNSLMEQERFAEAMVVVRQAVDLDPDSEIATVLKEKAKFRIRNEEMEAIAESKEDGIWKVLSNIEASMVHMDPDNPAVINDADTFLKNGRKRLERAQERNFGSESQRQIYNQLRNTKVQGEYRGTLAEAIEQLSAQTGLNIIFDDIALRGEGIEKDTQIDVPIVAPISLKSALDVILGSSGLEYVVEDEIIKVTSAASKNSSLVKKVYYIGDLVPTSSGQTNQSPINNIAPNGQYYQNGVMNVANSSGPGVMAQQLGGPNQGGLSYGGAQSGNPTFGNLSGRQLGGVTEADFDELIDLIVNTVKPDSWDETGNGPGAIQAFVPNLSLIVSQTQEIQDEIQDLLKKLRELNDVQIVIEVRFMILSDNFFERIGVDFEFRLEDNGPPGALALDNVAKSAVVGLSGAGATTGGDIEFTQDSFGSTFPSFGGFTAADAPTAANFGFAILSDIEVFFLLQAAKGSSRSSVMQAPTVTMFNGQSASINDTQTRPFVTSVTPVVGDFAVGHQPVITLVPDGTNLSVQAVVSDDRRFVRLNLSPFFSEIVDVQQFTFDGRSDTERSTDSVLDDLLDLVDGGSNADDSDEELVTRTQGITVQQPVVAITSVNTVVSVPDGGTVLLGGIKRLSEAREERGVPMLSNIPYINRLFKNVGIGQETQNLMMMVTPRILIQEELEEDQVGLIEN